MALVCRCGNVIENVPDHLQHLASWICHKCSNTSPRGSGLPIDRDRFKLEPSAETIQIMASRSRKAA